MASMVTKLTLYCKYRERALNLPKAAKILGKKCLSSSAEASPKGTEAVINTELDTGKNIVLKSGKLAKLADGCVSVTFRNTTVMATAVSKENEEETSFVPLTVAYQQKAAALGRIPLNFLRRELGQTESEILTSRLIDRSIRPLFLDQFSWETQVICIPIAVDGSNYPDVLAINAASAALAVSDIPWNGPVGAVRVGLINGEPVINPTKQELAVSQLNVVMASRSSKLVIMLEGSCANTRQSDLFRCLKAGARGCQKVASGIEKLRDLVGKTKRTFETRPLDPKIQSAVESLCLDKLKSIFQDFGHNKLSRDEAISELRKATEKELENEFKDSMSSVSKAFSNTFKNVFRNLIFETEFRCDGRKLTDIRPIHCEVDLYKPLHGSSLFQRGQTQVLCTVALDSPSSALRVDKISMLSSGMKEKNFFVHYEFPPFATNETKRLGPIGRREIGHGALAEKALQSNIPQQFPFTIRLTSEVLESNGSSSMATVCGGSLALMDAGIPVQSPCAGVAMGFISKRNDEGEIVKYKILTDLLGIEDYLGEMDFKIAGTRKAYTALQMDVKNNGVPLSIVYEILNQGKEAITQILQIMHKVCPGVRAEKKKNWPETEVVKIPIHLRSKFLGPGGMNLKKLETQTGVEVSEDILGEFSVFAPNAEALDEAKGIIAELLKNMEERILEFGAVYSAQITEIKEHGCMVTLYPNMKPVYIHVSQLDIRQVSHPSALGMQEGQEIKVKYFGRDPVSGAMRLSRKALLAPASGVVQTLNRQTVVNLEDQERKVDHSGGGKLLP